MKIHGKEITKPSVEVIVIPRKDGDLVFKAEPVLDFTRFDELCPRPLPPDITRPGEEPVPDYEDSKYLKKIEEYAKKRMAWMFITSLSATKGLEWDTINLSDSETWLNYEKELENSGLTVIEYSKLIEVVTKANGLNQDKIDEATKRFLASQGQE